MSTQQPAPSFRMQRVERMLQRRLAELIQTELNDPHLDMISISHIDVSKDLSLAMVYITILSDDPTIRKQNVAVLNKAASHLRKCLAKDSTWRKLPALRFKYDEAFEKSQRLVGLLADIASSQQKPDPEKSE